jgi:hypothetical protein
VDCGARCSDWGHMERVAGTERAVVDWSRAGQSRASWTNHHGLDRVKPMDQKARKKYSNSHGPCGLVRVLQRVLWTASVCMSVVDG